MTVTPRGPRMSQAITGHLFRQGLDQIDVAAGDGALDALDDGVVVEGAADIVIKRARGRRHIDIDREPHALSNALLIGIDPDFNVLHQVVHEDAIEILRLARRWLGRRLSQSLFGHDQLLHGADIKSAPPLA